MSLGAKSSLQYHKVMEKGVPLMKDPVRWRDRLTQGMDLAGEAVPGLPLVEICGERRVLIENHRGVSRYCVDQICVRVHYGEVAVCGHGLELARMSKEQLVICGQIEGVSLIRRGK